MTDGWWRRVQLRTERISVWLARNAWITAVILVMAIAGLPIFALWQTDQAVKRANECTDLIVDRLVTRANALTQAAEERQDALDEVMQAAAAADRPRLITALNNYVLEATEYDAVRQAHPVPPRPELTCPD